MLDHQDARRASRRDGLGELLEPVDAEPGVPLRDRQGTHLCTGHGTLGAPGLEADERSGNCAKALPLLLREVGQVHRVADGAALVLLDEQDVDDPDDATASDSTQLGHDATGCLELVEADDEDLDRTGYVLVCHCSTPLCCGCDYAAAGAAGAD